MKVSVTEAKGQLTELVRRAEAGDDIILTRHGQSTVRLVPVHDIPAQKARKKQALEAALRFGRENAHLRAGFPDAARSQDFLYDEDGMPA